MNTLKRTLKWGLLTVVGLIAILYITDTDYLLKAVRTIYAKGYTTAYLEDYKEFDNVKIENDVPQPWPKHKDYNSVTETERLQKYNEAYGAIAYVIIKNDSIWFENYYDGFDENSKTNSFSMAKSYVSGLMGKAIEEGYIKSLDQPVSDFFPEFSEGLAAKLTVGDLSSMSSGTNWVEKYYSPLSITTRAYFDDDLKKIILGLKVIKEPGQAYKYSSGDTQLLAMVIEKATGKKLYNYLTESFWKPLGSENETLWQVDSKEHDLVKAYCCIASNAKDFARFGKLYKDHGKWKGEQLLDSAFVAKSITPRFAESPQYGYGFWMQKRDGKSFFMMRGHLGQYVIVEPEDNIIIVRLGHQKSPDAANQIFSDDISIYIEEAYKMLNDDLQNQS
ncbi:beta-lactamase [Formosa sp. Hel3_A1_48]|jgi:CubicO group peptidase (beta-lactamase class C family)|uniref:serine hydrolase domain-containing protein n=1 Tax=Formosa sp. Hel3_A1_48 TaxID=1336795 RepID=UPI00084E2073|nr:serine hydrolase [Formosa sp. Hel3_A1_48]AOR26434.1 beta-lactamase [Formosa sp. Hel3_A1_48]MDC0950126.1 serine hydrolase [Flavobacteriaceae bacterium]